MRKQKITEKMRAVFRPLLRQSWAFPNLAVCKYYAEALCCTRSFPLADLRLRSFALICVVLRPTAFRTTAFGSCS